ncbi:hypothetical protein [Spirochaeta cellobiosiphila]|uniref:hypothetical protein n=1 Tax=Spirochaeta cellobiosiphila TaxID=504483 RepID=UPI0003FC8D6A|nr:hypothetical protein [Spirochaeta cellobiosiphila]
MDELNVPPLLVKIKKAQFIGRIALISSAGIVLINQTLPGLIAFAVVFISAFVLILVSSIMAMIKCKKYQIFWWKSDFYPINEETKVFAQRFHYRNILSLLLLVLYVAILGNMFVRLLALLSQ